jgi:4-hydroxybenzoate polyprenyltransferase
MNTVQNFLRKDIKPLAPILMILFVSLGRLLFEAGMLDYKPDIHYSMTLLASTQVFYTLVFFLFSCLMVPVLSMRFEKIAKLVSVGLLIGFVPPLLDGIFSFEIKEYTYFFSFSWTFFQEKQPISESMALWGVVGGLGVFTFYLKKSILRALFAVAGAYIIFQGCTGLVILIMKYTSRPLYWINILWVIISFACFCVLRWRRLSHSLKRIVHILPHSLLVLCGAVWTSQPLEKAIYKMLGVLFVLFVVLIQNDFYDKTDDQNLDESRTISNFELIFSYFFAYLVVIYSIGFSPIYVLLLICLLLVGFLYNHPATKLKKKFCLSYKAEGTAALLAFMAGTITGRSFAKDFSLFWPGLLVFGGGTLLSIPKDWKDVEKDRKAGVPSYYVLLTAKGWTEKSIHFWICLSITVGLFVLPIFFLLTDGARWQYFLLFALGMLPGLAAYKILTRKLAVFMMLLLFLSYLGWLLYIIP